MTSNSLLSNCNIHLNKSRVFEDNLFYLFYQKGKVEQKPGTNCFKNHLSFREK